MAFDFNVLTHANHPIFGGVFGRWQKALILQLLVMCDIKDTKSIISDEKCSVQTYLPFKPY